MVAPWNNTPPWLQTQPMATQPMQQVWQPPGAANPTLWQQATATQPQGGTQQPQGTQGWAVPTWAGGQAGPSWAASDPGAGQTTALGSTPDPMYAKAASQQSLTGGAASSQSVTPDPWGRLPGMPDYGKPPVPGTSAYPGAPKAPVPDLTLGSDNAANKPQTGSTGTGGNDWYNKIPEFTRGGGYPVGKTWNGSTWVSKGVQKAGTLIGDDVGWHTGLYLPTAYNPDADGSSHGTATGAEAAVARAIRETADYMRGNPQANAQHVFEFKLANFVRDAASAGQQSGFDPRQFAQVGYNEAYDPNKTYMAKGVSNPWTGKQAGNASGQDTSAQTTAPIPPITAPPPPPGTTKPPADTTAPPTDTTQTPTGGTAKSFGQFSTNDLASMLQAAANDPDRAAQILRLAQGQTGRPLGRMADFRDSLYGRAFQTALSTAGLDGFNDLQGTAQNFLNQGVMGNNLIGYSGDLGRKLAGQSFDGVNSTDMEKQLRAALALEGLNMGSMGGSVQQGRLDDLSYADWARSLADSSNDTRNFADLYNGSKFQRSLANYGR